MPSKFDEAYSHYKEEVADYTDDELKDERDHVNNKITSLDIAEQAKLHAIAGELAKRDLDEEAKQEEFERHFRQIRNSSQRALNKLGAAGLSEDRAMSEVAVIQRHIDELERILCR